MATQTKPPPLEPSHTLIYKTVERHRMDNTEIVIEPIPIEANIYLPETPPQNTKLPIFLYIHGGGWIHSCKEDYGRTWFKRFKALNYVVVSMDYRLLPESKFWEGQCEDVKDIEGWLREKLGTELQKLGAEVEIDGTKIIVAGASAGAHLALLTPKLWSKSPNAILSLYGPTDFHSITFLNIGPKSRENYKLQECTPCILGLATTYEAPPTQFPVPETPEDREKPRHWMGQHVYRGEILAEFLIAGLRCEKRMVGEREKEELFLPLKGSVEKGEIDGISPLHIAQKITYPPVYQMMGTSDWLFKLEQMTGFEKVLTEKGIKNKAVVVEGGLHGFDSACVLGDPVDLEFVKPAVEWLHGWL